MISDASDESSMQYVGLDKIEENENEKENTDKILIRYGYG